MRHSRLLAIHGKLGEASSTSPVHFEEDKIKAQPISSVGDDVQSQNSNKVIKLSKVKPPTTADMDNVMVVEMSTPQNYQ